MPFTFFFFNDTATTEIYTLSLHDALPIYALAGEGLELHALLALEAGQGFGQADRSEEHTSELQSHLNLVCRLLLEKKKKRNNKRCQQPTRRTVLMLVHLHTRVIHERTMMS